MTKTKKPKLIDTARALGIGKRTLQSWGELGCPIDGTPEQIRNWRLTSGELEPARGGRRKYRESVTLDDEFESVRQQLDDWQSSIDSPDNTKPDRLAAYAEFDQTLRRYICGLWSLLSGNERFDNAAVFNAWFSRALDGN